MQNLYFKKHETQGTEIGDVTITDINLSKFRI